MTVYFLSLVVLSIWLPRGFCAIPATLFETSGTGGKYGSDLLTFTSGGNEYLLVAEAGGSSKTNVDVYRVASSAITKVFTHTLASEYNGFAHDGTTLFVLGDYVTSNSGTTYTFSIKAYSLNTLISAAVTTPVTTGNKDFTLSVTGTSSSIIFWKPKISASYTSSNSNGYVSLSGNNGNVAWCKFQGAGLTTATCTGSNELSSGSSTKFGYDQIAFAPGTSILAVGDTSTGTSGSAGSIYLFDVSLGNSAAMTGRIVINSPTNKDYDQLGALFTLSSSTLYAYSGQNIVYSFKVDGSSTSPTSSVATDFQYSGSMALSVDGATLVLVTSSKKLQLFTVSSADGTISAKSKLSSADLADKVGYDAVAATAGAVFTSDYRANSNDGIVYVTSEDTTSAPTPSPSHSAQAKFLPYYRFLSTDCSGPVTAAVVSRVSAGWGALIAAVLAGKCSTDKDGAGSTKYGAVSTSEPDTGVYGLSYTTYSTQQSCQSATPDSGYEKRIIANGACLGEVGSYSCSSASTITRTTYTDTKCQNVASTTTLDIKDFDSCSVPEKGVYLAVTCTVEPKVAKEKDNAGLGIGLGVGLGGGALLVGGGAFYYLKVLAPHPAHALSSPVKVVPVAVEGELVGGFGAGSGQGGPALSRVELVVAHPV